MKYSEIPQVDIWRNELDIDYHHSTILKLLVSMNIEYQRIPGWIKNTFGKVMKPKKVSDPPRTFPIDTKVDSMVKEKTPWQGTFAACFTHDVDFAGARFYRIDRTIAGFLLRATFGSVARASSTPFVSLIKN